MADFAVWPNSVVIDGSLRPLILSLLFGYSSLFHSDQSRFLENKSSLVTFGTLRVSRCNRRHFSFKGIEKAFFRDRNKFFSESVGGLIFC